MYAIVQTGGKQYRVSPGDTVCIEKMPVDCGNTLELSEVLMIANEGDVAIGSPMLAGAKVICTVIEQDRAKKVMSLRYKAKKNVRVKRGHRQYFTRIRVDSIQA
jgi:large subunit ribosomal protein L21